MENLDKAVLRSKAGVSVVSLGANRFKVIWRFREHPRTEESAPMSRDDALKMYESSVQLRMKHGYFICGNAGTH